MVRVVPAHAALLAALGLLLAAPSTRACDPRLLPANTGIILKINVKQVMESELVKGHDIKALVQAHPLGAAARKFFTQMNFDPFTQLTSITLAHNGNEGLRPGDGFTVIEGAFDVNKFHETATVVVETFPETARMCYRFRGTPVYEVELFDKFVFCALVNNKSLVMAPHERALKAAMLRAAGDKVEAAKVAHMLKAAADKQAVNLVVTSEAAKRVIRMARPNGIPGIDLSNIRGISGGMTLAKDMKFNVSVANKGAKAAKELAATGTLALFAMRTLLGDAAKSPALAPLIEVANTLSIAAEGDNAVLTGTISQQNIERLFKMLLK